MRNTFISELERLREMDKKIHLLVGDLGFSVVESFQEKYSDSFHNIGVAEQNMIGIAAGMASEGLKPYCYSIANFPIFRPAEFIRNLIDYHNLNVCITAVGGGLAYGNLGYSHHAVQDFCFINSLRNFTTIAPADPTQVSALMPFINQKNSGPKYLRLNRNGEASLELRYCECRGLPYYVSNNKNGCSALVTTGIAGLFVEHYLKRNVVSKKFPEYHISFPIWGNQYKLEILEILSRFDEVFIFEDHILHGGFSNWIQNLGYSKKINKYSLVERYVGQVGTQAYFMEKFLSEEL